MNKVIIFSPHSDDIALSLGGAIVNGILGNNVTVYNVFSLSNYTVLNKETGDEQIVTKIRKAEEKIAMIKMGIKIIFLNYPEPSLRGEKTFLKTNDNIAKNNFFIKLKNKISGILNKNKNAHFLFPLGIGKHRDHFILREIALNLINKNKTILFYEDQPYAGKYTISEIKKKYVDNINSNLKSLKLPFLNIFEKIKLLKIYKSQFDAEDVYFSYIHTMRNKGEVIWGMKSNYKFIKTKENKRLSSLKKYKNMFDIELRERIISEYMNLSLKQVKIKMQNATENIAREWKYFRGVKKEVEFYKTTEGYIFELEDWHVRDKMKQAGMITIAAQAKNKIILEYGCGTADISLLSVIAGANEIHALDLPSKTLDFAKFKLKKLLNRKFNRIKFIESTENINKLKLNNCYYDIVSAEDVFEHVDHPEKHAKIIYDALKLGGSLFFSTEYIHSDFHPMHLKVNEKFNGIEWLYALEKIGFKIISPCHAIKIN
ncbi:hypothetical protein COV11_02235 [Candidatus Woesearchaeota archaeon CG10_big_fil_rev_8_21_14_0_10_30_7]|nr:MAG: hypothetical protein COV11_02235 [Candidatus Woesearchaeota archaeon CG10_big_fil_rev_8_21_14_0_10_30_7]